MIKNKNKKIKENGKKRYDETNNAISIGLTFHFIFERN